MYRTAAGTVVKAIVGALPKVMNIGLLLSLVFVIYAVAGMSLFGLYPEGSALNDDLNFRTFARSILTLYFLATGEGWNAMLSDCLKPPACFPETNWEQVLCTEDLPWQSPVQPCCPPLMWKHKNWMAVP